MQEAPFEIVRCSWPRPVEHGYGRWTSDPEWDAPEMPFWPQARWTVVYGEWYWLIDWRDLFRAGVPGRPDSSGEMAGFHILFHLRVTGNGRLLLWSDDGCHIRRDGEIIHSDPFSGATRRLIDVRAGDLLEVAQWQDVGGWSWGARWDRPASTAPATIDAFSPYLGTIHERLSKPNGPPLKMFTGGDSPVLAVVAVYSMILNGYAPSAVLLYGDHQWGDEAREIFAAALPFAQVVPTAEICDRIEAFGGPELVALALNHWFVMKPCVHLLYPPEEFCGMDDDVFVLGRVDDALSAFQDHDLVFQPDFDHGLAYLDAWGPILGQPETLHTGRINTGLLWIRNTHDPRHVASAMLRLRPDPPAFTWDRYVWGQGLTAMLFAFSRTYELPSQRYFFPVFAGMPGGFLEYDYAGNPCGFATIHFGGVAEKRPSREVVLDLASVILRR